MDFSSLKGKMEYYKSLADYKLLPNSFVIAHIDGRSFSKKVKKRFKLPFDDEFMNLMDDTAAYVCKQVQGCKLAYVQSDEISLIIYDGYESGSSFFGYRLCKMQSIIASLATCYFNQKFIEMLFNKGCKPEEIFTARNLFQFDCKCFNVPNYNDAFAWIKYRQNDCIKNSRQQAAQTYLPHKELLKKTAEEQVALLGEKKGIDWNMYPEGCKYGRLVYKEAVQLTTDDGTDYTRHQFKSHPSKIVDREWFDDLWASFFLDVNKN